MHHYKTNYELEVLVLTTKSKQLNLNIYPHNTRFKHRVIYQEVNIIYETYAKVHIFVV